MLDIINSVCLGVMTLLTIVLVPWVIHVERALAKICNGGGLVEQMAAVQSRLRDVELFIARHSQPRAKG